MTWSQCRKYFWSSLKIDFATDERIFRTATKRSPISWTFVALSCFFMNSFIQRSQLFRSGEFGDWRGTSILFEWKILLWHTKHVVERCPGTTEFPIGWSFHFFRVEIYWWCRTQILGIFQSPPFLLEPFLELKTYHWKRMRWAALFAYNVALVGLLLNDPHRALTTSSFHLSMGRERNKPKSRRTTAVVTNLLENSLSPSWCHNRRMFSQRTTRSRFWESPMSYSTQT